MRTLPKQEVSSADGVPGGELSALYPAAMNKHVVEHEGRSYVRRFLPVKVNGDLVSWNTYWEVFASLAVVPSQAVDA